MIFFPILIVHQDTLLLSLQHTSGLYLSLISSLRPSFTGNGEERLWFSFVFISYTVKTFSNWTIVRKIFRLKTCVYAYRFFRLLVSRLFVHSYGICLFVLN